MGTWPEDLSFETDRLVVSDWNHALDLGRDLASIVARLMSPATTQSLRDAWRGEYSVERTERWITERNAESSNLLVTDRQSNEPVGLLILFLIPDDDAPADVWGGDEVRIGYLFDEAVWGRGLASELVAGLVDWSREHDGIGTLIAGVGEPDGASARVLVKNGFSQDRSDSRARFTFRLDVRADAWAEVAAEWDEGPAARAYAAAAFDSLAAVLGDRGMTLAGSKVCDFGCGTGLLTQKLVDAVQSIDAVDTSSAMLEVLDAKVVAGGWLHVRLGREIPSEVGVHDLVLCSSVCSFLDDYPATLRRLAALLRPGGLFIQWDWERDETEGDPGGLSRAEIDAFSHIECGWKHQLPTQ